MQDTTKKDEPLSWGEIIGKVAAGIGVFGLICVFAVGFSNAESRECARQCKIVDAWRKHLIENGASAELVNSIQTFDIPREFWDKASAALNH